MRSVEDRAEKSHAGTRRGSAGRWALVVGVVGFACGFFGPIALSPEANQGPLLGIFISGPGGALLGAILGVVFGLLPLPQRTQATALAVVAIAVALVTLYYSTPSPQYPRDDCRCGVSRLSVAGYAEGGDARGLGRADQEGHVGGAAGGVARGFRPHAARSAAAWSSRWTCGDRRWSTRTANPGTGER